MTNKKKIINDPVYGFITLPDDLIYDLISHPNFQRLRRIRQLGLADFVYPGALHSRFQHAIGAMYLMNQALNALQTKGLMIMDVEREAAQAAILLHDIGHGPFSHVLEYALLHGVHHEHITAMIMQKMNLEMNGRLTLAIDMFNGTYSRPFFHQLISSQLDMDRMDYINRDSFFTGVTEGQIGVERIIKMLNVVDSQLVVEEKGLLSVENFLNARRLMYWQVYLHKTAVAAEVILLKALERVRFLISHGSYIDCSESLFYFLNEKIDIENFEKNKKALENFLDLDDVDIWAAMKKWQKHPDKILCWLASSFLNREIFKIKFSDEPFDENSLDEIKKSLIKQGVNEADLSYYIYTNSISNAGYIPENSNINVLKKNGEIADVSEASALPTIKALSKIVKKYYLCWANNVYLHD